MFKPVEKHDTDMRTKIAARYRSIQLACDEQTEPYTTKDIRDQLNSPSTRSQLNQLANAVWDRLPWHLNPPRTQLFKPYTDA